MVVHGRRLAGNRAHSVASSCEMRGMLLLALHKKPTSASSGATRSTRTPVNGRDRAAKLPSVARQPRSSA